VVLLVGLGALVASRTTAVDASGTTPAALGDFRSQVDAIQVPAGVDPGALDVKIVGGDAYVSATAGPGHTVVIDGYQHEPYLSIDPSGTVAVNEASPAVAINADRYGTAATGTAPLPAGAGTASDPSAPPRWVTIGTGGTVLWHDHRTHWMVPQSTPAVGADAKVDDWSIPAVVDGQPATIDGTLRLPASPSPLPWLLGAAALAALAVAVGRRHAAAPAVLASVAGALIGVATVAEWLTRDRALPADPFVGVVAVLSVTSAVALWALRGRDRSLAVLVTVALAAGWLVGRLPELWKTVLVTGVDPTVTRALTAVVLASAVAAAVLEVHTGNLAVVGRRPGGTGTAPATRGAVATGQGSR
jgi:hypothetical protein